MALTKLFEPITIKGMELKNRIVMPAMCTKLPDENGAVTEKVKEFYAARARGGVGLIITENTCVDWPTGKAAQNPLRIDDDKYIMGLNELADAVQFYGCKIGTQPQHTGRQTSVAGATEGTTIVSASDVPCLLTGGDIPHSLTISEISEIEDKFADAARRTKSAGMDCVEIHGAHGYLVTQFMSPYTNKRTDLYGGSLEKRMRFPIQVVQKIRKAVGENFPIIFRLSVDEYIDGGHTLEDSKIIVKWLEDAGVDILSISAGIYESLHRIIPGMGTPFSCHVKLAEEIKKVVSIPIIVVGKINDPLEAEKILQEGKADLIALGRPLLDPELPNKASEGKFDEIRPCIYCNQGCYGRIFLGLRLGCSVNPACGNEGEYRKMPTPTSRPEKVLVIGAGPGGIQAALSAAEQGHDVTIIEKNDRLGGKLLIASVPDFKQEIKPYLKYLEKQIHRLHVKVIFGREADIATVRDFKPTIVVIATGAQQLIPDISGLGSVHVAHAEDVLLGQQVGETVAILGGGQVGCETAIFLGDKGKKVMLIEILEEIGAKISPPTRIDVLLRLKELGVKVLTLVNPIQFNDSEITIIKNDFSLSKLHVDTIVLATGYKPNKAFINSMRKHTKRVFVVGDCGRPAGIYEAVHTGSKVIKFIEEGLS